MQRYSSTIPSEKNVEVLVHRLKNKATSAGWDLNEC
jgi:hypothetical protein